MFILNRSKLWPVVCKTTDWHAVASEMGFGEIDHSGRLGVGELIHFIEIAVVVDCDQELFAAEFENIL